MFSKRPTLFFSLLIGTLSLVACAQDILQKPPVSSLPSSSELSSSSPVLSNDTKTMMVAAASGSQLMKFQERSIPRTFTFAATGGANSSATFQGFVAADGMLYASSTGQVIATSLKNAGTFSAIYSQTGTDIIAAISPADKNNVLITITDVSRNSLKAYKYYDADTKTIRSFFAGKPTVYERGQVLGTHGDAYIFSKVGGDGCGSGGDIVSANQSTAAVQTLVTIGAGCSNSPRIVGWIPSLHSLVLYSVKETGRVDPSLDPWAMNTIYLYDIESRKETVLYTFKNAVETDLQVILNDAKDTVAILTDSRIIKVDVASKQTTTVPLVMPFPSFASDDKRFLSLRYVGNYILSRPNSGEEFYPAMLTNVVTGVSTALPVTLDGTAMRFTGILADGTVVATGIRE